MLAALVGCGDAVMLTVTSDRPVPAGLDAICVGIADLDPAGGAFGRHHRLEGALATLPQTLRIEAGDAASAVAWLRGDRGGVPVARAAVPVDFARDVTLDLARCERGAAGVAAPVGAPVGGGDARLAVSQGAGGQLVVAVSESGAQIVDVVDGVAVAVSGPLIPLGAVVALVAADLDGDCDDDVILATTMGPPVIWRRDRANFFEVGLIGDATVAALATADVDRDGDVDVVTGGGATLTLWRNDGSAQFAADPAALGGAGQVTQVSALALGDLDGDGNPDLVVGQAGGPLAAWLAEPSGTGALLYAPGVVPPVPLDVRRLVLADADGDLDPDLAVSVTGAPARLYIDREGRLEDQSFVRLPAPMQATAAVVIGGWDAGCEADLVLASDAGTLMLRGQDGGTFVADGVAPGASDAVLVDLDDDGDLDLALATMEGVQWVAR